eukprot:Gb_09479 [translate_table: standard]
MQDLSCYDSSTNEAMSCIAKGNNPNYRLGATKTLLFANNLGPETKPNLDMIKQTRKALDKANERLFNGTKFAYVYGYPYLFFEQYLHSTEDLLIVVGFALVGVFVAVLLFQCSFTIAFMIAIVLLMVDVEVFGFLYVIGAKLNSLSLVNLGIVIGMASEFTYLARCFLAVDGTRNERVGKALELTFEPLLHGLGTQIAATFPLIFLKYHAFRLYYFAMFTIMGVLGFLNGFVLLPVLLSVMGPPPLPHVRRKHAPANATRNENDSVVHSTVALVRPDDISNGFSPAPAKYDDAVAASRTPYLDSNADHLPESYAPSPPRPI